MTIGPKKKISKTKGNTRHATWQRLNLVRMSDSYPVAKCKNCGATKLAHHVCSVCGYYKGKQVITIKSKSKGKVIDA
ncbi:MAG: 50S ribosomal protein L32 [candidate division SR1 bacterium CG_4_9_14_3_um_filter_40_9]|nr:MAG: 50S ribosomal protein L32 [candidate division SR1 bacterium CG_4_9_14_3_um_filter_40_9]